MGRFTSPENLERLRLRIELARQRKWFFLSVAVIVLAFVCNGALNTILNAVGSMISVMVSIVTAALTLVTAAITLLVSLLTTIIGLIKKWL